jgi:PAS domain-containing protein
MLVHPDDMPSVKKALKDHLEGASESYQCENRLLKKDGTWRWNLDMGRVVKRDESGKPLRMVGSDTDTSGFKEAEFALRASEQHLT